MRRPVFGVWAIILGALAIATAGGVAVAAVGIPGDDGRVHSCYATKSGAVRLVRQGEPCSRNEEYLSWDQNKSAPGAGAARSVDHRVLASTALCFNNWADCDRPLWDALYSVPVSPGEYAPGTTWRVELSYTHADSLVPFCFRLREVGSDVIAGSS